MADEKKRPAIRFQGFDGDWEQRKLGEVAERVTRKNKNLESTLPLTISAQDGLIDQNEFFNKTVASRDVSGYYLMKNGEFAYNKSYSNGYPWGAVKRLDRYDMGVLSTLYIIFKPTKVDSTFLAKYYDTDNWYKEVSKHAAEGARNHGLLNIAASDFFETELLIPSNIEEQSRIGDFFSSLDNLITLHQRKHEKLKIFKKAMLEKMFPKNGQKVPELRFPGFDEDWEQRKLGELLDVSTGKLDANAMVEDGEYDFYTSGIKKYRIDIPAFEGPAITIAGNGATVGYMHLADGKFNAYQRTYVLEGFQADRQFLYSEISNRLPRKIAEEARTGNIPYIVMDMLTDLNISLPVTEEEQRKIGTFFSNLDNLITLHQRKVEKLQIIKKSVLEKMFV
jgi:type I restriction enzyme S subunit